MQNCRYIHREIENILKKSLKSSPAVALTGPRQSGKSTLTRNVFGKSHAFISLDDPIVREKAMADPKLFIEEAGERVILDEIQYVPEILSYLKIIIDTE